MSLPNYLAKIKSSGMYRFTFDKSQLPAATAETMRLVIGYSEKGPFNNPVYVENKQDFINLFGNINKRLEKKGVFFNRLALQALSAGPILALNLKPFDKPTDENAAGTVEQIDYVSFDPCEVIAGTSLTTKPMNVLDLFDRDRFWKIEADQLPYKINKKEGGSDTTIMNKYINIAATDALEESCSIFIRKCHYNTAKQYDVIIKDWYKSLGEDIPDYLEGHEDDKVSDYFAEVYVFRGKFTAAATVDGRLSKYFNATGDALNTEYKNGFNESADALAALASDENSNFIAVYRGCLLPFFKDQMGSYISLDVLFNADKDTHKMIMKLDDSIIESKLNAVNETDGDDEDLHNKLIHWPQTGWDPTNTNINTALKPTYIKGYSYGSLRRTSLAPEIYAKSLNVLTDKGIYEALTNHVDSEYHYIIDTFNTIVSADADALVAKNSIAAIAKAKDNCLAIMNAPAMADLQKNIPNFNMDTFEKGDYKTFFSLPSEVNGASYCAYYTPLVFGEGLVKQTIPSAALVSNLFMEKWNSRQPYYIVAGPNYGRIDAEGLVGPDYNYSKSDLDVLEPMGINCIIYVPRKGTYINSNQTAKQIPVSALSKVHVRELVIYLQNEIENMMQNYQWELNTQALRDKIKTSADAILDRIKANGGVYDFLNVCDGTNNTPEIIDNEMVILDTSIEPARGAGKMVQRLTIHKTGGISALVN